MLLCLLLLPPPVLTVCLPLQLSDKLFMSLNQRDWPSLVACHHELYNRTMPRHRQPSDKEDSAEAKRKSVCHALRHIGSATKELANAAASLGYE